MQFKSLILVACLVSLCGCAAPQRYKWAGYDELLYKSYKDPNQIEALREGLESNINALEQSKQRVAPGLYAELGTLYFQQGDSTTAAKYYVKERDTWPESKA